MRAKENTKKQTFLVSAPTLNSAVSLWISPSSLSPLKGSYPWWAVGLTQHQSLHELILSFHSLVCRFVLGSGGHQTVNFRDVEFYLQWFGTTCN